MASRQAISALKDRISRLVTTGITDGPVAQSMSEVEFVKQLITAIVSNAGSDLASLSLELPSSMEGKLQDFLKSGALAKLGKGLDVVFDKTLAGGFRVGPADQGFVVSFTDEGFAEFFREYLRPHTRQFLFGDEG
jgi:V/A-type H+-transporting ATPase subunit E